MLFMVLSVVVATDEIDETTLPTTTTAKTFINFTEDYNTEFFSFNGSDYIFINRVLSHKRAIHACKDMKAHLAILSNSEIVQYVTEALAESRFEFDTLWVAGVLHGTPAESSWSWEIWEQSKSYEVIAEDVLKFFVEAKALGVEDVDNQRRCLGFGRDNHLQPSFRPLSCSARRHVICQQARGAFVGESSHKGWIQIGNRLFKIFVDKATQADSETYCGLATAKGDSTLAVITSVHQARVLARYMLIGRPSVEMAWIGAKWNGVTFVFYAENLVIPKSTSSNGYPPWLGGKIGKTRWKGRCAVLDRHLSNFAFFVELGCLVPRARICYRKLPDKNPDFIDIMFEKWSYRIIITLKTWQESVDYCNQFSKFKGRLVEITEAVQRTQMLYVMGENKTNLNHVWLGGKYINHKWIWNHAKTEVDKDLLVKWIHNKTYFHNVDENYVCLNMDLENHIISMFYGTECDYLQYFVCLFPTADLRELQKQERQKIMLETVGRIYENPDIPDNSSSAGTD